ncbi:MAG: hypothetical protein PUE46_00125 [Eubacteriales bacterium]|nr:hypothetical protein [Eubacteriales bacterium]
MTQGIILKSVATNEDLAKIQQFSRRELLPEEIYVFNVDLCNNDVDRDYEKFSVETLEQMAKLFVGKTGIFDHSMKSADQTARIFDAFVEKVNGKKTADGEDFYSLKAKAYMLNNEQNRSLIDSIDAGIKKEVSVSCSVDKAYCSICHTDRKRAACEHRKGKMYGDRLCFNILTDATDAYEFSFVAVPAQREAGVTKSFSLKEEAEMQDIVKMISQGDEITLSKSQTNELYSYIEGLKQEAELGEAYKKKLIKQVVDLFKSAFPKMEEALVVSVASVMTSKELLGFCDGMKKSLNESKIKPQLAVKAETKMNDYSDFKI